MNTPTPLSQRGGATLAITLVLAFVMLLTVTFAGRSMLLEQRTSNNQLAAIQSFERAEAGLEWVLAQLNTETPVDADCVRDGGGPAARPYRELDIHAMQMRCGSLGFDIGVAPDTTTPGALRITSTAHPASDDASQASAQMSVARLPGLDTLPAAALTVRGHATFLASWQVAHTDPRGHGVTVHTGAPLAAPLLQLTSTPGTPPSTSAVADDAALAQLAPEQLFASLFRMNARSWREQPVVTEIDCEQACDAALLSALQARAQLLWLRGGLQLNTPATLGTLHRPVLLIADGPVVLNGAAIIHGMVYTTSPRWVDTAGSHIQGAVVAQGDLHTEGSTHVSHDADVLQALRARTGTYARLPGSWRDARIDP